MWSVLLRRLASLLLACAGLAGQLPARDDGGVLRPDDVVALVGGEDMVVAGEQGYLEYLVVRARPDLRVRFRSLTKEGDTAFEQARDFNYPGLDAQLASAGATIVLVQLGQMESLRGEAALPAFTRAAETLIARLRDGGRRRVVIIAPTPVLPGSPAAARFAAAGAYRDAVVRLARRQELPVVVPGEAAALEAGDYRDGLHLSGRGQQALAAQLARALLGSSSVRPPSAPDELRLLELVRAKNRLWFHYVRPQNWAFLDGDRTVQPASRDHRDPERRWFPEEMKAWLPLVAAREDEAWRLAQRLPAP